MPAIALVPLLLVVGVLVVTVAALAFVVVVVRRQTPPGLASAPPTDANSPSALDPIVATDSDAVHSEASTIGRWGETSPVGPATTPADRDTALTAGGQSTETLQRQQAALDDRRAHLDGRKADLDERRSDLERREQRLAEREERLDSDIRNLDDRSVELGQLDEDLAARRLELLDLEEERRHTLERLAGLSADEARAELIADIEADAKRQAVISTREIERAAHEEGQARAREILTTVIQRLASEQTAESVVSSVHLTSDDLKGRIIGREGRNIRAFEQTTGVNLIVDDAPEVVLLSCFDPVRREVGRLTLQDLVSDGRIHPSRIEEVHERNLAEVNRLCQRAGEDALVEVGVTDLHPHLVFTLGQLRYRTSYGQNVLKHLVESAQVAGLMADELGLNRALCMRAAFLHDIGKALTHESEGSHAIVGAELARKHGESADVVHAIQAHHNEIEPRTVEAVLTQAADAVSGGRPGARRESPEVYVQRMERLEEIAMSCPGVEKVFAMQAGRDVRVMVLPDVVDDIGAQVMARDIVKQIEHELSYPGQIKVTVIRESRATEIAR